MATEIRQGSAATGLKVKSATYSKSETCNPMFPNNWYRAKINSASH